MELVEISDCECTDQCQNSVNLDNLFSYFCMVLNLPLYHGKPLSRMMLGMMMRKKMMGFIHR